MKRLEFLGLLAGLPLAFAGRARTGEGRVPDDVADHIIVTGTDGKEYQFKNDAFKVRDNAHQKELNKKLTLLRRRWPGCMEVLK
jgi:hypothetical protein